MPFITWTLEKNKYKAEILAQQLGLKLEEKASSLCPSFPEFRLCVTDTHLEVQTETSNGRSVLFTEFVKGALGYRRRRGGGIKQAIAKAVGIKSHSDGRTVLDATAGLGADAFVLASLGCRVELVERSPIMAALLRDGLERARRIPELIPIVQERMNLVVGDAVSILAAKSKEDAPDVIYLDPMFPDQQKSALNKIELRMIRAIVGQDVDAADVLKMALQVAKKRVVVKRPPQAPFIADLKPSMIVTAKKNRYDIYLRGGM